jgi:hypothetical protein
MPQHPGGNDIWSWEELSSFRFGKPEDVRRLERENQEMRWAAEGRSQFDGEDLAVVTGGRAPDQDYIRECIRANERTLDEMRPPQDLTSVQMNKYARLHEELEKDFTSYMPSKEQMEDASDSNVELNMAWQEHKARKTIAWMNCRQILDPLNDNPFFTSVESIRPATPPKNDPRRIRENWALLRFTEEAQRKVVTVDDSTYQQFVLFQALDWSDVSIKKSLGLTQAQFEAALDRLQSEGETHRVSQDEAAALDVYGNSNEALDHLPAPDRGRWMQRQMDDRALNSEALARDLKVAASVWQEYLQGRRTMPLPTWQRCRRWLEHYDEHPERYTAFLRTKTRRQAAPEPPSPLVPRHSDDELEETDEDVDPAEAAGYELAT